MTFILPAMCEITHQHNSTVYIASNIHEFVLLCAASGEPPMCMSCSVLFAVKKAIGAARREIDDKDVFALCKFTSATHCVC